MTCPPTSFMPISVFCSDPLCVGLNPLIIDILEGSGCRTPDTCCRSSSSSTLSGSFSSPASTSSLWSTEEKASNRESKDGNEENEDNAGSRSKRSPTLVKNTLQLPPLVKISPRSPPAERQGHHQKGGKQRSPQQQQEVLHKRKSSSPTVVAAASTSSLLKPTSPPKGAAVVAVAATHDSHHLRHQSGRSRRTLGYYEVKETMGTGVTSKVKKGRHIETGELVALKILDKEKTRRHITLQLETEIKALQSLCHPHIAKLHDVDRDALYPRKNGLMRPSIVLTLELASNGELFDYVQYTGVFCKTLARTYFRQLASAIEYCHENCIYHCDIKLENLLLDSQYQLKIADFGLAAMPSTENDADVNVRLKTKYGTLGYMSPESFHSEAHDGNKSDVWSIGVVLFVLLSGGLPFQVAQKGDWWYDALRKGKHKNFWQSHARCSPPFNTETEEFLMAMFQVNPDQRLSSSEVAAHEWLKGPCLSDQALFSEMFDRQVIVEEEMEKMKNGTKKWRK